VTSVITGDISPLCSTSGVSYSVVPTAGSVYSWTVPVAAVISSGATGPDNNAITVDFGTESGTITVTETTSIGCQGIPVQLDVNLVGCDLVADFTASDTNICVGEEVTFTSHSLGTTSGTTFEWEFGDGATPSSATLSGPHVVNYTTPGLKTVRLVISNGLSDTLVKTDYILVNPVPGVVIESAERCGPGSINLTATLTNADRVDFSTDDGVTVASTDNSAPYVFTATLGTAETIHVMGKAYNMVSGCSGAWEGDAFAVANVVPVSEKIASSHIGISVPGYVDVVCSGQQNVIYYVNAESNATYNWNVPGLGITANGVSQIEIDWDVAGGDYRIEVQKISNKACSSAIEDTLVLVSQPKPSLGEDVIICEGSSHTFSLTENYDSYEWNDGSTDPTLTVSSSGQVFVKVWDEYQCNGFDTASLLISTTPIVDLGRDTVLCGDNSLELDAGDFDSYSWSTGETMNPITVREGAGNVSVIVTNADGCEGTDEIIIKPCDPVTLLGIIPNTITPNDDNVHDTWKINNISLFPQASIQIYDRWGRVIYEQNGGYENDWNGKDSSGKDLPVDTYFYIIDLKVKGVSPISGDLTIIR
jgi:gliding motility-associated-like protein